MKDNQAELEKAVRVVKIGIGEAEKNDLLGQLNIFTDWLKPLLAVDTGSIEPLLTGHDAVNVMRKDEAVQADLTATQNTTSNFEDCFYAVPKIIE